MGILIQFEEESRLDNQVDESNHFEGFEKRLELEFCPRAPSVDGCVEQGLRALTRNELDEVLQAARCTIVSELKNRLLDSYVLSESSLFVYPFKVILKTCGTTRLLKAIPVLLAHARRLLLDVKLCKYTRGCFIFPNEQLYPHGSFEEEVHYLDQFFGKLGGGSKSCVMGDAISLQKWHVYVASAMTPAHVHGNPVCSLEMCMTQLGRREALQFCKGTWSTASEMTHHSGIRDFLPNSEICDFAFDPCGYSMNSVEGCALSTIHVTPEDGYSYASFEAMGYGPDDVCLDHLVDKVLGCFRPTMVTVAIQASGMVGLSEAGSWGQLLTPCGYVCKHLSREELPGGSMVILFAFQAICLPPPSLLDSASRINTSRTGLKSHVLCGSGAFNTDDTMSALKMTQTGSGINSIKTMGTDDAFYVMDIEVLLRLWRSWKLAMPRVHPFYAVKCNTDMVLLSVLASLGAGFDVASKAELEVIQSLGVGGDRVIFANPCKLPSHIAYAASCNVHVTTFDSEAELHKISKWNPQAEVVLCIRSSEAGARCPLEEKYRAEMEECEELLCLAKYLGLQVVGVAFHVGSGASDSKSFASGIARARGVFDLARFLGFASMRLLDIGGGFVSDGGHGVSFSEAAHVIRSALDEHFPVSSGVTIIAEPGRFFAEDAFTLAAQVFGSRMRVCDGKKRAEYWINDGIYGSMNCLLYDHAILKVRALPVCSKAAEDEAAVGCESTIFDSTCDGLDTVMQNVLVHLEGGGWLLFPRMEAYTKAAASKFQRV